MYYFPDPNAKLQYTIFIYIPDTQMREVVGNYCSKDDCNAVYEVVNLSYSCTALKFHVILSHLGLERYWVGTRVDPSSKKVSSHVIWVL